MKILVFAEVYYPDVIGGGEFSTKLITEGLAAKGHEVTVYCLGLKETDEEINGVHVHRRYVKDVTEHFLSCTKNNKVTDTFSTVQKILNKKADIYYHSRWYRYYYDMIVENRCDVVHSVAAMSYLGRMNLWKAAYDCKIPVSHVCRSPNLIEFQFLNGRLDNFYVKKNAEASKYLTALAAPSKYMLDCHTSRGIKGRKFNTAIYNAVDFLSIEPSEAIINRKKNLIVYAGDVRKEKGISTLIEAVKGIKDAELLIIGRGEMSSSIVQDEKVRLIDWLDKDFLYEYMQLAKIVVLPSEWNEAFGRILIEGISNCTISIGSDRGGIPEVLNFDKDYIFHSGKMGELRKKLNTVINYTVERYIIEIKRQQEYAKKFSINEYVENWENFFMRQI